MNFSGGIRDKKIINGYICSFFNGPRMEESRWDAEKSIEIYHCRKRGSKQYNDHDSSYRSRLDFPCSLGIRQWLVIRSLPKNTKFSQHLNFANL